MHKPRLINATTLVNDVLAERGKITKKAYGRDADPMCGGISKALRCIEQSPTIDVAEAIWHDGNTTFVATDNLQDFTDRIIVVQGNWCNVYYRDNDDDAEEEG